MLAVLCGEESLCAYAFVTFDLCGTALFSCLGQKTQEVPLKEIGIFSTM